MAPKSRLKDTIIFYISIWNNDEALIANLSIDHFDHLAPAEVLRIHVFYYSSPSRLGIYAFKDVNYPYHVPYCTNQIK